MIDVYLIEDIDTYRFKNGSSINYRLCDKDMYDNISKGIYLNYLDDILKYHDYLKPDDVINLDTGGTIDATRFCPPIKIDDEYISFINAFNLIKFITVHPEINIIGCCQSITVIE